MKKTELKREIVEKERKEEYNNLVKRKYDEDNNPSGERNY